MRQVVILSGVSGAGKSTYAERLLNETQGIKVSADHYFTRPDGSYHFDPTQLGAAHADCFRRFITYLQSDLLYSCILVDNTNLSAAEISPYYLGAESFYYTPEVHTLWVPDTVSDEVLAARNVHGVGVRAIQRQRSRLRERTLPPFWNSTDIQIKL